ncbi:DUF4012 domain-containing protein [Arthrobacter sp. 3Tela_A]|uniref:DUF4012 domain-containing protein n=1 Tax=Arthrobacter sp. 3Tela_A TaxID=3093743 RepID=UPI003BB7999C
MATAGVVLFQQVNSVKAHLSTALDSVPEVRAHLTESEVEESEAVLERISHDISTAKTTTDGPLWRLASALPGIGPNFSAVAEVTVTVDDVATRAAMPLVHVYGSLNLNDLAPRDGKINLAQLEDAAPTVSSAADSLALSADRLDRIDVEPLLDAVAGPILSARQEIRELSSVLDAAASATKLLPSMLGAEESRNFLILVQNSAETRATGGIPGALAILTAQKGEIELGTQSSASALGRFVPTLEVDPVQVKLFTSRLGSYMQNVNLTPDFPTAAATAKNMWEERYEGTYIDGVLALDPVVLSYLLDVTGPVKLSDPDVLQILDGTELPYSLTGENVVDTLLSDVYREIEDTDAQDAYFAAVANEVFTAFMKGGHDSSELLQALSKSADERRLYLWSNTGSEQAVIASTALSGEVTGAAGGGASFGVYYNDGTGAKMDYYARRTVELRQSCSGDGYSTYTVRLSLANTAPQDAAESLPSYVTGNGQFGVAPGDFQTNYVFYGPSQALVESARLDGVSTPIGSGLHGKRPVGTVTVNLAPGQTAVLEVDFTRVIQSSEPHLVVTPTLIPMDEAIRPFAAASACE